MSAEYKVGTPADIYYADTKVRGLRVPGGWSLETDWASFLSDDVVSEVRPLVVLDPDDREQVARLNQAFCDARQHGPHRASRINEVPMMQAALRSLLVPPKPPEPQGLGAVVEDASGERWMRIAGHEAGCNDWRLHRADDVVGSRTYYIDIDVVRVLSDGWEPKP